MIEDKVDKLDPWEMQDLVGGLLEAMNYKSKRARRWSGYPCL
jgi:restriction system protein